MLQNTSVQGLTAAGKTWLSNTSITGQTDINVTGTATTTIGGTTTALNSTATTVAGTLGVTGRTTLANVSSTALTTGPLWAGAINVTSLVATGNTSVQNVSCTSLTSTGNVGIGTTTPQYRLDVSGTMNVTGAAGTNFLRTQDTPANTITDPPSSYTGTNIFSQLTPDGTGTRSELISDEYTLTSALPANVNLFLYTNTPIVPYQMYKATFTVVAPSTNTTTMTLRFTDDVGLIVDMGTVGSSYKTYTIYFSRTIAANQIFIQFVSSNVTRTIKYKFFSLEPFYNTTAGSLGASALGANNLFVSTSTNGNRLMQVQDTPTNTEIDAGPPSGTNILSKFIARTNGQAIAAPVSGVYTLTSGTSTFYANFEAGYLLSGQTYKITLRVMAVTTGTGISFDNTYGGANNYKLDLGNISTTAYKTYIRYINVPINDVLYVSIYGTGSVSRTINFAHFSIEPFYTTTVGSLSATGDSKIGVWHMSNQISRFQLGTSHAVNEYALEHSPGGTVLNAYYNQFSNANIEFKILGSTKILMNKDGKLGIGTIGPEFPLHVYNNTEYAKSSYATLAAYWINGYGAGGDGLTIVQSSAAANVDSGRIAVTGISICSEAGILIKKNALLITSDRRIKSNIVDVDDDRALVDLRKLKPKTYTYKDTIGRSSETVYGFIAQEVKEVLDYSSRVITDTIPNLYELATFSADTLTLTFNTADLSRDASGALFTKLKVKTREGKDEFVNILEILDEHTLQLDKDLTEWGGMIDASGELVAGNRIFVYGQEVNDFHTLNKEAIWTVATAALQEVDRQLQAEKQKTATLETTLSSTQATLAAVLARLDALEQRNP